MDFWSRSPFDLTGQVTKSSPHPFASGSYGDIYRGLYRQGDTSIDVAIKTSKIYLQSNKESHKEIKQFHREITVWWRLKHPNVLPFLGTIVEPSLNLRIPAMVCPLAENGALTTYLREKSDDLTFRNRLSLINDVAHGVQYLHSQQIVHGDLSGSNVLIYGNGTACIADFGLSTMLMRLDGSTFATTACEKGTRRWMAPELLDLDDPQAAPTTQSDVYSFGSITLQILTGDVPYHYYPRDAQVTLAIAKGVRPDRPEAITNDWWEFMQHCWTPAKATNPRPSGDNIIDFTKRELAKRYPEENPTDDHQHVSQPLEGKWNIEQEVENDIGDATAASTNNVRSRSAFDLTGQVTKLGKYPYAISSFGDIYQGIYNNGGSVSNVAIKTFKVHFHDEQLLSDQVKQFRRDMVAFWKLDHPNVLPVLGTVTDHTMPSHLPAMVSPWVDNGSLTNYLERNDHLTDAKRLMLMNDVAHGLQYLHSQHMIYGNLSGSNVLVNAHGRAYVAAHGMCHMWLTRFATVGTSAQVKDSVRWTAPELLLEDLGESMPVQTMQSDIYSFGRIMLQILTGKLPYHYFTRHREVILAIVQGKGPMRPDLEVVTDARWKFMERCWSPVKGAEPRPSSDEVVKFTEEELADHSNES